MPYFQVLARTLGEWQPVHGAYAPSKKAALGDFRDSTITIASEFPREQRIAARQQAEDRSRLRVVRRL